jgi:phytoene/squalene synthetase
MQVMTFDAKRRGYLIRRQELADYECHLAAGVTEALHYFIGHGQHRFSTSADAFEARTLAARTLAARGAHITHMLRDTLEDIAAGYFNIPLEVLELHGIAPDEVDSQPYRAWVQERVQEARICFAGGRRYLGQVRNLRCRLAGYLYMSRFERVLDTIEREDCWLRAVCSERYSTSSGVRLILSALAQLAGVEI